MFAKVPCGPCRRSARCTSIANTVRLRMRGGPCPPWKSAASGDFARLCHVLIPRDTLRLAAHPVSQRTHTARFVQRTPSGVPKACSLAIPPWLHTKTAETSEITEGE